VREWTSLLKEDPTNWLLETDHLSVGFFALTELLEKTSNNPEVKEAKTEIMNSVVVPKILAK
jgi:hypothetical protein